MSKRPTLARSVMRRLFIFARCVNNAWLDVVEWKEVISDLNEFVPVTRLDRLSTTPCFACEADGGDDNCWHCFMQDRAKVSELNRMVRLVLESFNGGFPLAICRLLVAEDWGEVGLSYERHIELIGFLAPETEAGWVE